MPILHTESFTKKKENPVYLEIPYTPKIREIFKTKVEKYTCTPTEKNIKKTKEIVFSLFAKLTIS